MDAKELALTNLILESEVGSRIHGISIEGTDDRDLMGVCVEPPGYVIGLRHFEQWVSRDKPEGVRSEAGDTDRVVYSLRKYMSLALKGNPTILLLLFAPPASLTKSTSMGRSLQDLAGSIISKQVASPFLGYMKAQHERLLGIRGQKRVHRPELEEKHGYDTKYASHIIRLGLQGVELLCRGFLTLPMTPADRAVIMSVRTGEMSLNDMLTLSGQLRVAIQDMERISSLRDEPDFDAVNTWLVNVYRRVWQEGIK